MSAIEQTEDQWHVQIEAGDVRLWTLDQLDAAFKAELVDESTFVLEVGKTEWMQLGTLLGGGDGDDGEKGEEPAAVPQAQAVAISYSAPPPAAIIASSAPVMMSEAAPSSFGDRGPYSTAPMASDIDDFEPPASFRGSRKRPIAIGIGALLLAAGVAVFGFTRAGGSPEAPVEPVAAAAPPPVTPPSVVPAVDTQTAPQAATPTSLSARLTQDQLDKLASADKVREAKLSAQQKSRAAAAPKRSGHHAKEKGPFHSGGDKYDPLNAKL